MSEIEVAVTLPETILVDTDTTSNFAHKTALLLILDLLLKLIGYTTFE